MIILATVKINKTEIKTMVTERKLKQVIYKALTDFYSTYYVSQGDIEKIVNKAISPVKSRLDRLTDRLVYGVYVTNAAIISDFTLKIDFSNGQHRIVCFENLTDKFLYSHIRFQDFQIVGGALVWNNELTFEPKDLLEGTIKDVTFLKVKC